ncbi:MAG: EamA family transporter [Nanoarchaeota archaeon]|nr:EamA family transporter [Nanoarchaeota archaeon]
MLGLLFAVLSAFSKGFEKILHRYVLVKEDSLSYAFIWHLLASLFFLPFFIIEFNIPKESFAWGLVLISAVLWAIVAYTGFRAYSHLQVSLKEPIGKSKMLFVLLLSVIFLKEAITTEKVLGTILIFAGIVTLTYKKGKRFGDFGNRGVQLTLLSAFLMSVVLLVDKYATNFFNPGMYSFMVYFLPSVVLFPFVVKRKTEIRSIVRNKLGATIATVFLGAAYYYLLLRAFKLAEASAVVPIVELGTLIAVFGGIKFLKEREQIPKKIIAAVIVVIGAVLLSGVFRI